MIYYFAYGSNMDQNQMSERCPDSVLVCKAVLKNYRIAFTIFSPKRNCGCADVVKDIGNEVWGLLYKISENDLKRLDEAENHPDKYRRFTTSVENGLGNKFDAETYEVVNKESIFLKSSEHYLGLMKSAAKKFSFPDSYQNYLNIPFT
jgi:gamma-glutamylcyclotransferase (GGCT)/AIG2-like uncharacterized protein YtfP